MFLFVLLFWIFRRTRNFFTQIETSPSPMKGCNLELCSARMDIEKCWFLSVPHLLWHGASFLKWSSPRTHDTDTYCRVFGNGIVNTFFLRLRSVAVRIRTLNLPHPYLRFNRLRHPRGFYTFKVSFIMLLSFTPELMCFLYLLDIII